jgi:hypothetical protein
MPAGLQDQHRHWTVRTTNLADVERGVALARTMLDVGDDPDLVERQLLAVGVSPSAATEAAGRALAP